MIWIVLLIFCFGALLFICAPLYGAPPRQPADDLSDYRAALDEIEDEAERRRFERRILQTAPVAFTQARPARPQRGLTLGIFTFILLLTPVIYLKLGAPELTGRLADAPPPLSPAVAAAASEFEKMTPKERSERITAMVDGLSSRLIDTPQDAQGWLRLLRARKVLGQETEARAEIARMREALAGQEPLIAEIISQSGWNME